MKPGIYTALAALAASLVQAHGGAPGAPKIFGRSIDAIGLEQPAIRHRALRSVPAGPENIALQKRANANGQCGQGYGSCAAGQCCSAEGYCGTTSDYCAAPDCQFNYGPACDANKTPAGSSTSSIARPLLGSVPYGGGGIYDCVANGVIALTFDDGPYIYTNDLLDLLAQYGAKATFFITGNNLGKGAIDTTWATVIKRMATDGHQIASHTWSHQDLSNITQAQRKDQMVKNEMAFRNILGYFPTYMRPPYSSCSTACQTDLKNLGYHITYFDLDTDDYDNTTPQLQQNAKNNFDNAVKGSDPATSDFLSIEHDIHEQTVHNLTVYILQRMQTLGYKGVTVGDCLGDPIKNWYRNAGTAPPTTTVSSPASTRTTTSSSTSSTSTSTSSTSSTTSAASPTSSLTVTTDASCGGTKTCQGSQWGNCCSVNGWCGSTDAYCGAGCQPLFGTCSGSASTSPKPSTTSTTSSTSTKPTTTSTTTSNKPTTTTTSTTSPTSTVKVSTDGSCGTGKTCQGSQWGNCCSQYGWCGSEATYCGTGCQKAFGSCT